MSVLWRFLNSDGSWTEDVSSELLPFEPGNRRHHRGRDYVVISVTWTGEGALTIQADERARRQSEQL